MKGKRILVVSQHYWPENFRITDICAGFAADGCEVDVLCGLPNYPKGEWFEGYRYTGPRRESHAGVQIFRAGEIRRRGNPPCASSSIIFPSPLRRCSICRACTEGNMTPCSATKPAPC